jgi:hypothetical protein
MTSTITHSQGTIVPALIDGYESTREGRSITHEILGTSNVDVTLRPAAPRTGTLRLLILTEAGAAAAELALARAEVFTLTDPERPTVQMQFVVPRGGKIARELDTDTRDHWIVAVDFHEVTA